MRERNRLFFFFFSVCVCVMLHSKGSTTRKKRRGQTKTKKRRFSSSFFLIHAFLPGLTYIVAAPGVSMAKDAATRAMGTSTDVKRSPLVVVRGVE